MVHKEDIERLAGLAKLSVKEEEKEELTAQMSDIVDFVSQVQEISADAESLVEHKNIMREDGEAHQGGLYTKDLLSTATTAKGNTIVVSKIISND